MSARSAVLALLALAAPGLIGFAAQAQAQIQAADAAPAPRFAFAPVEGGALKLDTQTGQVSLCTKGTGGFACTAVPDSRDAYEAEIARLQAEIAALRQGAGAQKPDTPPQARPDPSEISRAFDYATQLYRRFRQMIDELTAPDKSETL
ncbi:hypothetical protein [Xanthobacter sediminis]